MKITHMLAAALMVAGIGAAPQASAQRYDNGYNQEVRYDRDGRDDRRWDRRDDRRWDRRDNRRGWQQRNNGRHYGWRNGGGRNNCRVVYRHGDRYTVCR